MSPRLKRAFEGVGGALGVLALAIYTIFFTNTLFTAQPPPTIPNKTAAISTSVPTVENTDGLDSAKLYKTLNDYRAGKGLSSLRRDSSLDKVAKSHAEDMKNRGYYNHTTPDGITSYIRVNSIIGRDVYSGENQDDVCPGATNSDEFMRFSGSKEHNDNMIDPRINTVGIGYIVSDPGKCNGYVVFDFAQL